jgi:hypothetical protein
MMKRYLKKIIYFILDLIASPFVIIAAVVLKYMKRKGLTQFKLTTKILNQLEIGVIHNNYYEPVFLASQLEFDYDLPRDLVSIDWNIHGQIELLNQFNCQNELLDFDKNYTNDKTFYIENPAFGPGDIDFWYQLIRLRKSKRIIEVGSGHSTLLAQKAIEMNFKENSSIQPKHICIEPYEKPWLSMLNIELHRKKVEEMPLSIFEELEPNDILFIDSSHIIRPQGDVLYIIQHILPKLKSGVIVHFHDIFSPHHYPKEWIIEDKRLWNEQYLLEVFLTNNHEWKIISALNYLKHFHYKSLYAKCPLININREPGSFYIQKI